MKKIFIVFSLLIFCLIWILGCGPEMVTVRTTTRVYQFYEDDFTGFTVPEIDEIKKGESRVFPYTEFDDVWNSAIIVLMQQGIILRSSKEAGIIVVMGSWPLSIFVERGEPVKVYINLMEDLYRRMDHPEKMLLKFKPSNYKEILDTFLDTLAIEVYANNKWKYLYIKKVN